MASGDGLSRLLLPFSPSIQGAASECSTHILTDSNAQTRELLVIRRLAPAERLGDTSASSRISALSMDGVMTVGDEAWSSALRRGPVGRSGKD